MSFTEPVPEYEFLHDDIDAWGTSWNPPRPPDPFSDRDPDPAPEATAPSAATRIRRTGAAAAMFTALAMAYKEVFEPEKGDNLVIEIESSEGVDLQPVEFLMVPGNPKASRVIIRRWLMR